MNRKNRNGSKEAIRKPRFQAEWRKSFGFVISIVFLFDLLLSVIASNGYINKWNGDQIYSNIVTSIVQNDLDMTKVKMQDGMIRYIGSNEEEQVAGDDVISKLNYYSSMNMMLNSESVFAYVCTILMDYAKGILTYESNPACYIAYFNSDGVQLANGDGGTYIFMGMADGDKDADGNKTALKCYRLNEEELEAAYPGLYHAVKVEADNKIKKGQEDCNIGLENICVNGYTFLAKRIVLRNSATGDVVKSWDLDKLDLNGYAAVAEESDKIKIMGPLVLDCSEDSPGYQAFHNTYQNNIVESVQDMAGDAGINKSDYRDYNSIFRVKGYTIERVNSTDSLYKVVVLNQNFFRDFAPIVFGFYFLTLILATGIAFAWAKVRFSEKETAYQMEAYRRRMTNAMAHDLKSPLMAISGYAEIIAEKDEEERSYANNILDTISYMNQMIANILNLAKLEDGGIELKRTEVSLDRLFTEQKELFAKQMSERHLTMRIEGKKTIQADAFWMEHLVNNLVSNAMKYAKDQSEILIHLGDRSFIVQNPFDKELNVPVEQLKEAFVKGDNVRSNENGNGLGLCIVDQIARAHGYHMDIQVKEHEFIVEILL